MDEQVEDDTQGASRRLRRVTESDDVHRFLVKQAAHGGDNRVESLDKAAHQGHAPALCAGDECPAGLEVGRYRLLDEDRFAELEQHPSRLRMERCRGRDDRGVAPAGRVEILGKRAAQPLRERSHPLGVGVDDDREVGAFRLRDDARVVGPHRPGSDQRNAGTSTHWRSLSRADLPDRKFAGPFR